MRDIICVYLLMNLMNLLNVTSVPTDSCMPLSFSGHLPHADYKVRGATLPRMGSGENRGRRGSTGTHRIKEAACEQRENPDKHQTPPGGKGSSKSRQHSGTRWILFHIFHVNNRVLSPVKCFPSCLSFRIRGCLPVQSSIFPIRSD